MNQVVRPKLSAPVLYAFLLALLVATLLIATYYLYVPLRVDSGWYSYSALCLSEGRDPGENYAKVDDLRENPGVKAIFNVGDDFRRSIRIIPMALWFKAIGTNIWGARLFGILEYYILLAIMYLVLRKMCRDRNILLLCFAIYLLDSQPIWYGSTNLRPDVLIAAVTLSIFLLTQIDETTKHRMVIFFTGIVLVFFLPLIRINAAISLVLLLSYFVIELSLSWHDLSGFKKRFYMSLIAAGITGYLLRDYLLDMIIPTGYSSQLPYHMDRYAYDTLKQRTSIRMLLKELERWAAYFRVTNIGTLLAILLGVGLLLRRSLLGAVQVSKQKSVRIGISCLAAVAALAIFAPRSNVGHALSIGAFFILFVAREIELISFPRIKKLVIPLLALIVLVSVGMRLAQVINVAAKSIRNGFSNLAVAEAIDSVFDSSEKNYVVFGATELWPYFNPKSNVLIVDFRHERRLDRLSNAVKSVDYIIVDKFYEEEDWENNFLKKYPGVKLKTIRTVGHPNSGWYFLKVMKPTFSE